MQQAEAITFLRKSSMPFAKTLCEQYDRAGKLAPYYLTHALRMATEIKLAEDEAREAARLQRRRNAKGR